MTDPAECQACGAMLPPPDAEGHVTCLSCGGRSRRSRLPPPPDDADLGIPGIGFPRITDHRSGSTGEKTAPPGCVKGGIVTFVLLMFVLPLLVVGCVVVAVVWPDADSGGRPSGTPSNVIVLDATTFAPASEDSGSTSVAALVQETSGGSYDRYLSMIDVGADRVDEAWRSEALGRNTSSVEVAPVGRSVAAVVGDRLLVLDRGTGARRWETRLSDVVTPGCADCLLGIGSTVVVRTADGQVRAYRETSSEPRWSRTLAAADAEIIRTRSHLVIVDDPGDGAPYAESVDPATGSVVGRGTTPCAARHTSMPTTVAPIPGQDAVLLLAGYAGSCAARFDAATGTAGPDLPLPGDLVIDATRDDPPVFVGGEATLPVRDALALLDVASGAVRTLPLPDGVTADPTTVIDGTLLATTAASRGTPVGGLAAWDVTTGALRWSTRFPDRAEVLALDDSFRDTVFPGSPAATVGIDDGRPVLITFRADDASTMTVEPVDLASGDVGPGTAHTIEDSVAGSSFSVSMIDRGPVRLVLLVDWQLLGVDADGTGPMVTFGS